MYILNILQMYTIDKNRPRIAVKGKLAKCLAEGRFSHANNRYPKFDSICPGCALKKYF